MRAVVFEEIGKFGVHTLPDPTPGPHDLIIQVSAVGICGTDVHLIDGELRAHVSRSFLATKSPES